MKYLIPAMSLLLVAMLGGCAIQQPAARPEAEAVQKSAARQEAEALYQKGLNYRYYEQPVVEGQHRLAPVAELLEQAIAADSTYAPAYAQVVYPLWAATGYREEMSVAERRELAGWMAEKALELDPDLPMAHVSMGIMQEIRDWDVEGAEASFKHALALDPDHCEAQREYAQLLYRTGRFEEGLVEAERAYGLDSLSLQVFQALGGAYRYMGQYDKAVEMQRRIVERTPLRSSRYRAIVFTHMMNRSYEEALKVAREVMEIDPDAAANNRYFGWAAAKNGMLEEALAACEKAHELRGNLGDVTYLGWVNALMGRRDEALQVINELEQGLEEGQYGTAWNIARIYLALDEKDPALDWLERSCEMRLQQVGILGLAPWGWQLATEEDYDPLRSDPRFQALVEKTGYKK